MVLSRRRIRVLPPLFLQSHANMFDRVMISSITVPTHRPEAPHFQLPHAVFLPDSASDDEPSGSGNMNAQEDQDDQDEDDQVDQASQSGDVNDGESTEDRIEPDFGLDVDEEASRSGYDASEGDDVGSVEY